MIDKELVDYLTRFHRKQANDAATVDFRDDPGPGLKGIVELSSQVMNRVTRTFSPVKKQAGSWVSGESLLLQLLTQRPLTVDLTVNELKKIRPFDMPIESLCSLARHGFLYLNVRDFDSEMEKGFPEYGTNQSAKNLRILLREVKGSIYFGSALRKPLFDAAIRWSGRNGTYEQFRDEAISYLDNAAKAYELEIRENPLGINSIFRSERQNLTAAAWHWAFLNSVYTKIPNIFDDEEGRVGLVSRFGAAYYLGDKWSKNRSPENQIAAATAFLDLAGDLRTSHLNFTAPITASWGSTYNMTSDEFERSRSFATQRFPNSIIGTDENWRKIILIILAKSKDWDIPAIKNVARGTPITRLFDNKNIDEGIVDILIERMMNDSASLREAKEIGDELRQTYLQGRDLSDKEFIRMVQNYDRISQLNLENYISGLEQTIEVVMSAAGAFDCWGMPYLLKAAGKTVSIKTQNVVEKILLPDPQDRMLYRVIRTFNKK